MIAPFLVLRAGVFVAVHAGLLLGIIMLCERDSARMQKRSWRPGPITCPSSPTGDQCRTLDDGRLPRLALAL